MKECVAMQPAGVLYLWGRGEISTDLRNYLDDERSIITEFDDIARKIAIEHGCPLGIVPDAWAWRVQRVSPSIVALISRNDPHVLGWTQAARQVCPPSLALRNVLNTLTAEEIKNVRGILEERFAKPGRRHLEGEPNHWIASDGRMVYFDEGAGEWALGDYIISTRRERT